MQIKAARVSLLRYPLTGFLRHALNHYPSCMFKYMRTERTRSYTHDKHIPTCQLSVKLLCVTLNPHVLHSHENSSGYYRTSVYFLAKLFADLLPNRMIPIFIFTAIAYYMMGKARTNTDSLKKYTKT